MADRLATGLRRADVSRETPVAVALSRGPRYVAAMLAVLKAGGMIVPLDPAMPGERVAEILRQTSAPVVIDEACSPLRLALTYSRTTVPSRCRWTRRPT